MSIIEQDYDATDDGNRSFRVTINLRQPVGYALEQLGAREARTMSQLGEFAVRDYLARHGCLPDVARG